MSQYLVMEVKCLRRVPCGTSPPVIFLPQLVLLFTHIPGVAGHFTNDYIKNFVQRLKLIFKLLFGIGQVVVNPLQYVDFHHPIPLLKMALDAKPNLVLVPATPSPSLKNPLPTLFLGTRFLTLRWLVCFSPF